MSDRGQPVKTVPEGAPPPTEPVLRERAAPLPIEDAYHSKRATLREDEDEVLSGSMSAGRASDLLGQLDRLMSEYRSLPADDAELMKWRHRIERHDRLQDEIDAISDHLGVESPLDRGPASRRSAEMIKKAEEIEAMLEEHSKQGEYLKGLTEALRIAHEGVQGEYQGPGPSTLEEYYEEREKPGSEYRLGETLLPEADPDPLIEGMATDEPAPADPTDWYLHGMGVMSDFMIPFEEPYLKPEM